MSEFDKVVSEILSKTKSGILEEAYHSVGSERLDDSSFLRTEKFIFDTGCSGNTETVTVIVERVC